MSSYLDVFWGTAKPPILTPNPTHKPLLTAENKSLQANGVDKNVKLPQPPTSPTMESELSRLKRLTPSKRQAALKQLKYSHPNLHSQIVEILRAGVIKTPAKTSTAASMSAAVQQLSSVVTPTATVATPEEPVTEFGEPVVSLTPQEQMEARQRAIRLQRFKASASGAAGMMTQSGK